MNSRFKRRFLKPTPAEVDFKRKHDETKALASMIGQSTEDQDPGSAATLAEQQLLEKLNRRAKLMPVSTSQMAHKRQNSGPDKLISQSTLGGGSIHNNINVAINYTVHQQVETTTSKTVGAKKGKRTKAGKAKRGSQDRPGEQERRLNSSMSQLINDQLLKGQETHANSMVNFDPKKSHALKDSMTKDIFEGDRILLANGNMAFRPLGMETKVLADSKAAKQKARVEATYLPRTGRKNIHSTELNIALQQQLDCASAEDLISINKVPQFNTLQPIQDYAESEAMDAGFNSVATYSQLNMRHGIPTCKSVQKEMVMIPDKLAKLNLGDHKGRISSAVSPGTKNKFGVKDSESHPGLRQLHLKSIRDNGHSSLDCSAADYESVNPPESISQAKTKVQFQQTARRRESNDHMKTTQGSIKTQGVTGGLTTALESYQSTEQIQKPPKRDLSYMLGEKLFRQKTGNSKVAARKLRESLENGFSEPDSVVVSEEEEEDPTLMRAKTVIKKPLPDQEPSGNKMIRGPRRSGAGIDSRSLENNPTGAHHHRDHSNQQMSQLAIDYKLAMRNRQSIQNLMNLLQKNNGRFKKTATVADETAVRNHVTNRTQDKPVGGSSIAGASQVSLPNVEGASQQSDEADDFMLQNSVHNQLQTKMPVRNRNTYGESQAFSPQNSNLTQMHSFDKLLTQHTPIQTGITKQKALISHSVAHGIHKQKPHITEQRTNEYKTFSPCGSLPHVMPKTKVSEPTLHSTTYQVLPRDSRLRGPGFSTKNYQKVPRSNLFDKHMGQCNVSPITNQQSEYVARRQGAYGVRAREHEILTGSKELLTNPGLSTRVGSLHKTTKSLTQITNRNETQSGRTTRTQSLQFDKGLTFVMVKGKVQPSEKYIYRKMLPYTNAQPFQSLQVKSSQNRQQLFIKNLPNQPVVTSPLPTKNKGKGKKGKGSKVKRQEASVNAPGGGAQSESILPATIEANKKMPIAEVEEFSGSEGTATRVTQDEQMTWQDYSDENQQLKQQILDQIAIFEQYLKVASLQQMQRETMDKQEAPTKGLSRLATMDQNILRSEHFQFEQAETGAQLISNAMRRTSTVQQRQPYATITQKSGKITQRPDLVYSNKQSSLIGVKESPRSKRSEIKPDRSRQGSAMSRHSQSSRRSVSRSSASPTQKLHRRGISMHSLQSKNSIVGSVEGERRNSARKSVYLQMGAKIRRHQMKALEFLSSTKIKGGLMHTNSHQVHNDLVRKIEKLWQKLNQHRNSEVVGIQNEIWRNKRHIQQLTRENLFELDVNTHDQRMLLKARQDKRKFKRQLKSTQIESRVQQVQKRIREQLALKEEFDTWGFHNHIIEHRIKLRMTEDVIDCAQRLTVKADDKTKRELRLLTILRDRTYEDLHFFVRTREKKPWRHWDRYSYYHKGYKPAMEDRQLNLAQATERVEVNLKMIAYLEPRYKQLLEDIPPYNLINGEMIQFISEAFGNEGWLQLFQLRLLRRQQEQEQHAKQYLPPVEHIKRLEVDPYTLQIESGAQAEEPEGAQTTGRAQSPVKKPKAWDLRKPDKITQSKLKTGYEPVYQARMNQTTGDLNPHEKEGGPEQSIVSSIQNSAEVDMADELQVTQLKRSNLVPHNTEPMIKDTMKDPEDNDASFFNHMPSPQKHQNFIAVESNPTPGKPELELPSGAEVNKFEGDDVLKHLKDKVEQHDEQETEQKANVVRQKSNWLQTLEKERKAREDREAAEKRARAARLAILFDEDDEVLSQDDEDLLDAGAANQGVGSYMDKIDTHLKVEKRLLEAWQEKDESQAVKEQANGPK